MFSLLHVGNENEKICRFCFKLQPICVSCKSKGYYSLFKERYRILHHVDKETFHYRFDIKQSFIEPTCEREKLCCEDYLTCSFVLF